MQGYWAEGGSWWPATLEGILPDGDQLELRMDPTPAYRDVCPLSLTPLCNTSRDKYSTVQDFVDAVTHICS